MPVPLLRLLLPTYATTFLRSTLPTILLRKLVIVVFSVFLGKLGFSFLLDRSKLTLISRDHIVIIWMSLVMVFTTKVVHGLKINYLLIFLSKEIAENYTKFLMLSKLFGEKKEWQMSSYIPLQ